MPDIDFAQLRELASKATPRPWTFTPVEYDSYRPGIFADDEPTPVSAAFITPFTLECDEYMGLHDEDAAYIVAAANALPAIMDECERAWLVLANIRALARTGLPISGMTPEDWALHRLNMIAADASHALKGCDHD